MGNQDISVKKERGPSRAAPPGTCKEIVVNGTTRAAIVERKDALLLSVSKCIQTACQHGSGNHYPDRPAEREPTLTRSAQSMRICRGASTKSPTSRLVVEYVVAMRARISKVEEKIRMLHANAPIPRSKNLPSCVKPCSPRLVLCAWDV